MHTACIKKFFGTTTLPVLDYTIEQLDRLAMQIIQDQTSLTGVQPKLSRKRLRDYVTVARG